MSNRLTIQFIGSASDKKDVRLNDFIEQLRNIKKALRETELAISGENHPTLDYKIVDMRHTSPSTMVLEPVPIEDNPPVGVLMPDVVNNFTAELRLIKREKKLLIEPDLPRLQAYQEIGKREHGLGRIEKVKIRTGSIVVTIDSKFKQNLDEIVGPDEFAEGSVAGMLDAVNFHNANKFTLYPMLGARKISGTFNEERLRIEVKKAIGSFVTVFGRLRFKAWADFPHGIIAEDIDIHEPDSHLPTLTELRGEFAGMTGDMSSVAFVNQLRNEDWQQ
jgi:hypothetical protein